ncbi:hypothetical protein SDC9_116724 [bioreactor metagenome]|uniref:Uncharacterized protein n=1 Tax=bioreactor metagenome TaxID=1076179 RepID=A0A645BW81_9ZZZZ
MLLQTSRELGAGPVVALRLMDDDRPRGAFDAARDGFEVERLQASHIDHLDAAPFLLGGSRRVQAGAHHRTPADQRDIATRPHHRRLMQAARGSVQMHNTLLVVTALRLEEDHRIGRGDGLLDHPVAVVGVRWGDHRQSGGVREVRLDRFGVVLDAADAAAVGEPDDDRQLHASV